MTTADDIIDRVVIPLSTLTSHKIEKDKWHKLETKGEIRLEINYDFQYEKYLKFVEEFSEGKLSEDSQKIVNDAKGKTVVDYNAVYNLLMKTLILYTKDIDDIVSVEGKFHYICVLKIEKWINEKIIGEALMDEFAMRYGVPKLYQNLTYLTHIRLQPKTELLQNIELMLRQLHQMDSTLFTYKEVFHSFFRDIFINLCLV